MAVAAEIRHQCMIYDGSPARTLPAVVAAIAQNLGARKRCMYLNSPAMVAGVRSYMYAAGIDVAHEVTCGRLVLGSDDGHLVNGHFSIERMLGMLDAAVQQALDDGYAGLFATGDMTWEFGPEKDFSKLLEYEWRLEQMFHRRPELSGICQYHRDLLPREAIRECLVSHGNVFVTATISQMNPHYLPAQSADDRRAAAGPALDEALKVLLAL